MRIPPASAGLTGFALMLSLIVAAALADPLPCAEPETNPLLTAALAGESLRTFQAGTDALPPLTLPPLLAKTWQLDLTFKPGPLAVTEPGALTAFAAETREGGFRRINCAELAELKGTILCLFDDIVVGNLALFRAVTWIDGSAAEGPHQFIGHYSDYAELVRPPFRFVDGMDLRWADLKAYYEAARAACPNDKTACLNHHEEQLFNTLLFPLARERPDFVLLGAGRGRRWIISHEVMHAQYFLIPKYRAIVDCYFDQILTPAQRADVLAELKAANYDTKNAYLMRNEFQAYLLQDAGTMHLPRLRATDRERLLQILHASGEFPLMLNAR